MFVEDANYSALSHRRTVGFETSDAILSWQSCSLNHVTPSYFRCRVQPMSVAVLAQNVEGYNGSHSTCDRPHGQDRGGELAQHIEVCNILPRSEDGL